MLLLLFRQTFRRSYVNSLQSLPLQGGKDTKSRAQNEKNKFFSYAETQYLRTRNSKDRQKNQEKDVT
jgi:hypothetical protein